MDPYIFDNSFSRLCVLDKIPTNGVCAEIGVLKGDYANLISLQPIDKLYLIDPWTSIPDVPHRWHAAPQEEMNAYKLAVHERFQANESIEIIEKYSNQAVIDFEDNFFDWIYLDSNHSYDFVKEDLGVWWSKLKPGGFFCGNAYIDTPIAKNILDFGVIPAVDDFIAEKFEDINSFDTIESQYIIEKKSS
jgi:hypothetical protein